MRKPVFGVNQPVQPQKLARGLKFRTYKLEILYYLGSEQQRYCADCGDARAETFVVRIWQKQVWSFEISDNILRNQK